MTPKTKFETAMVLTKLKDTKYLRNKEVVQAEDKSFYLKYDDYEPFGGPYRCQRLICHGFTKNGAKCLVDLTSFDKAFCSRHMGQSTETYYKHW